jgi:hypothetical protein
VHVLMIEGRKVQVPAQNGGLPQGYRSVRSYASSP